MPLYDGPIQSNDSFYRDGLDRIQQPFSDAIEATARDAWMHNPMQEGMDFIRPYLGAGVMRDYATGNVADPDAFNKQYGDIGLHIDSPISRNVADLMVARKQEELRLNSILARAPDTLGFKAAALGTSLAVSAIDPLNVAASFVPVVGESRAALWAARFGKTAARVGEGAIEGATGAALLEPIRYANEKAYEGNYGAYDSFLNVTMGGILGGGLHAGFGAVSDLLGRAHPETREGALRSSVAQMAEGRPVDVAPVLASDPALRAPETTRGVEVPSPRSGMFRPRDSLDLSDLLADARARAPVTPDSNVSDSGVSFTTAKGSTYELHADGTTTRNKAARPEHPGEVGPQPRSEATYFVDSDEVEKLSLIQAHGPKTALVSDGQGNIGVKFLEGPHAGKVDRSTIVRTSDRPTVGTVPVETWNDGQRVHFGNDIRSVEGGSAPLQPTSPNDPAAARDQIQRAREDTLAASRGQIPSTAVSPQAANAAGQAVKTGAGDDLEEELQHALDTAAEYEKQGVLSPEDAKAMQDARDGIKQADQFGEAAKAAGRCLLLHP